jgi:hypothetical protein
VPDRRITVADGAVRGCAGVLQPLGTTSTGLRTETGLLLRLRVRPMRQGQQLKCLTVTDEFTKEGLAIDVDGRTRSPCVIDVLPQLVSARGAPGFLRSDNGPEFISKALLSWMVSQGIGTALIEPGELWHNG